ncbi:MAG: GntR family transcriptional regulator [Pirellulales bacterium]
MSDRIRAALEQRIIDGTLQPGERLLELNIAKEFDTSQTPVREAFRELESVRLVESVPYRGTRVRAVSDREMLEAYDVRGALEQLAAQLAAAAFAGNVAELRTILAELHAAGRAEDGPAYSKANSEFHRAIVRRSGNQVLFDAWNALGFEVRVRILLARHRRWNLQAHAAEHDPIVDALEIGDGLRAGRLLLEHAENCKRRWCELAREDALETADAVESAPAGCLS